MDQATGRPPQTRSGESVGGRDQPSLTRDDFRFDALELRRQLQQQDFAELPIRAEHCLAVQHMNWHHRDPFDRLLIAQPNSMA